MQLSASTMIHGCLFDKGSLVLENATLSQLILASNVHCVFTKSIERFYYIFVQISVHLYS